MPDGVEWSTSRPGRVYPKEGTPVLIEQEAGGTQQPVWMFFGEEKKIKISYP